jgi:hypothetical protein
MLPDGSGRVRIHFFVRDDAGPVSTPGVVHQTALGQVHLGGARGYIACRPKQSSIMPGTAPGGMIEPTVHTDDGRAATCPECLKTEAWAKWMATLADVHDPNRIQR